MAPAEARNWSAADVFIDNRYVSPDTWYDGETAKAFQPQVRYFVGGATKLYGAPLYRLREKDFGELRHPTGSRVADLLRKARALLHADRAAIPDARRARGGPDRAAGEARPYPFPAVLHEGLVGEALPLVILSAVWGLAALALLWRGARRGAHAVAVGAVAAVIWPWGVAQYPYLLPGMLKISAGAADHDTLVEVLIAFGAAVILVLPPLGLLYVLGQRNVLEE